MAYKCVLALETSPTPYVVELLKKEGMLVRIK